MDKNITHQTIEDKLILALSGRLDFPGHKSFQTAMAQAQATDHHPSNFSHPPAGAVGEIDLSSSNINLHIRVPQQVM